MGHYWPDQDIHLEHFAPSEFDHPEGMDAVFLRLLDTLRERCGFPIKVLDDYRTKAEHDALYRREIAEGRHVPDSAHLRGCAVDIRPLRPSERAEMVLVHEATGLFLDGTAPALGFLIETRHFHLDHDPHLANTNRRPYIAPGVSR